MGHPADYVSTDTMRTVRALEAARRAVLLRALPFRLRCFQRGMRDEQMPNHGLERFRVRRRVRRVDYRNNDTHIRDLRRVTAIAANYAQHSRATFLRKPQRRDQIRAHVL